MFDMLHAWVSPTAGASARCYRSATVTSTSTAAATSAQHTTHIPSAQPAASAAPRQGIAVTLQVSSSNASRDRGAAPSLQQPQRQKQPLQLQAQQQQQQQGGMGAVQQQNRKQKPQQQHGLQVSQPHRQVQQDAQLQSTKLQPTSSRAADKRVRPQQKHSQQTRKQQQHQWQQQQPQPMQPQQQQHDLDQQQQQQQCKEQQRKEQTRKGISGAAVQQALRSCNSWHSLKTYLHSQPQQKQSQQHPKPPQQLWQLLNSYHCLLVVQLAAWLAINTNQQQQQQQPGASRPHSQQRSVYGGPPSELQQLLVLLAQRAALRIQMRRKVGEEVAAAKLLRAVGRLDFCVQQYQYQQQQQQQQLPQQQQEQWQDLSQQQQPQQQQQQQRGEPRPSGIARRRSQLQALGQQLLDCMCCADASQGPVADTATAASSVEVAGIESAAAAALPDAVGLDLGAAAAANAEGPKVRVTSAKLLAGVAKAVMQLQLQPSQQWLLWFERTSLQCLQQDDPQQSQQQDDLQQRVGVANARPVSGQELVEHLQLPVYIKQQQQQQRAPAAAAAEWPSVRWQQVWVNAACQLAEPFSNAQLSQVTAAVQQLQLQLPISFWQRHLQASAVAGMPAQQLLQLLPQLPVPSTKRVGQQQQQERDEQLPEDWRAAAAAALPAAACEVAAGAAAAAVDRYSSNRSKRAAAAAAVRLLPAAVWAAYRLQLPLSKRGVQQILELLVSDYTTQAHVVDTSNPDSTSPTGSSSSSGCSILQLVPASAAVQSVFALAQLTHLQPPPAALLLQLQTALLPLLPHCDTDGLVNLLWVFAAKWRVQLSKPWLTSYLQVLQQRLGQCTAIELRLLGIALAKLQVRLPLGWQQAYLHATAAVMGLQLSTSSSSSGNAPGVQEQHVEGSTSALQQQLSPAAAAAAVHDLPSAAFVANVGCSLAQLQVVPPAAWQLTWQRNVLSQLQYMSPDQAVDTLRAAAAWVGAAQQQAAAAGIPLAAAAAAAAAMIKEPSSVDAGVDAGVAAAAQPRQQGAAAALQGPGSSTTTSSSSTISRMGGSRPALLPKPQLALASSSRGNSAAAGRHRIRQQQQQQLLLLVVPNEAWIRVVLQHLRHFLPECTPTQLTTALVCLGQLRYKASVAWMDALCDALLSQLEQCSMLQLQQLLRGLLHQRHELAPARIDAVLDAALVQLGRRDCSEQQLVWLLQLMVQLHHEPEPEWTEQVAAAAEHMLSGSSSSQQWQQAALVGEGGSTTAAAVRSYNSSNGWSPELLTDLLDNLAQLGPQQLPDSWPGSYRRAAQPCLRQFSGSQLARMLSAAALLHWQVPRPFLQQLLQQLQLRMASIDAHALGLAGVAVGQMELLMCGGWTRAFLRRLQQLARSKSVRIPVSDASNLQRSVQYLRWCGGSARGLGVRQQRGTRRLALSCSSKSRSLARRAVGRQRRGQMGKIVLSKLRRRGSVQLPNSRRIRRQGRQ